MNPHAPEGLDPEFPTEVPEADALEQATPAVPDADVHAGRPEAVIATDEVDPADAWEQHLSVPGDDEDYEHEQHD